MFGRKLRAAFNLSLSDWGLLVQAWWWLLLVDLGLRVIPFARLHHMVATPSVKRVNGSASQPGDIIQRTGRIVDIASRYHIYQMSCLRRSMVSQRLFFRQGLSTELRFGVNKESGELKAHAWLEFEGAPIGEPETLTDNFFALANGRRTPFR